MSQFWNLTRALRGCVTDVGSKRLAVVEIAVRETDRCRPVSSLFRQAGR